MVLTVPTHGPYDLSPSGGFETTEAQIRSVPFAYDSVPLDAPTTALCRA
jgi:hypothetical protein